MMMPEETTMLEEDMQQADAAASTPAAAVLPTQDLTESEPVRVTIDSVNLPNDQHIPYEVVGEVTVGGGIFPLVVMRPKVVQIDESKLMDFTVAQLEQVATPRNPRTTSYFENFDRLENDANYYINFSNGEDIGQYNTLKDNHRHSVIFANVPVPVFDNFEDDSGKGVDSSQKAAALFAAINASEYGRITRAQDLLPHEIAHGQPMIGAYNVKGMLNVKFINNSIPFIVEDIITQGVLYSKDNNNYLRSFNQLNLQGMPGATLPFKPDFGSNYSEERYVQTSKGYKLEGYKGDNPLVVLMAFSNDDILKNVVMKVLELNAALEEYKSQLGKNSQFSQDVQTLQEEMLDQLRKDIRAARDNGQKFDEVINLDKNSAYKELAALKVNLDLCKPVINSTVELNAALEEYKSQLGKDSQFSQDVQTLQEQMMDQLHNDIRKAGANSVISLDANQTYQKLTLLKQKLNFDADINNTIDVQQADRALGQIGLSVDQDSNDLKFKAIDAAEKQFIAIKDKLSPHFKKLPPSMQLEIEQQLQTLQSMVQEFSQNPSKTSLDLKHNRHYQNLVITANEIKQYYELTKTVNTGTFIQKINSITGSLDRGLSKDKLVANSLRDFAQKRLDELKMPITSISSIIKANRALIALKQVTEEGELRKQAEAAVADVPKRNTLLVRGLSFIARTLLGVDSSADKLSHGLVAAETNLMSKNIQTSIAEFSLNYKQVGEDNKQMLAHIITGLNKLHKELKDDVIAAEGNDIFARRISRIQRDDAFKKLEAMNKHLAVLVSGASSEEKQGSLSSLQAMMQERYEPKGFWSRLLNWSGEYDGLKEASQACLTLAETFNAPSMPVAATVGAAQRVETIVESVGDNNPSANIVPSSQMQSSAVLEAGITSDAAWQQEQAVAKVKVMPLPLNISIANEFASSGTPQPTTPIDSVSGFFEDARMISERLERNDGVNLQVQGAFLTHHVLGLTSQVDSSNQLTTA